MGHVSILLDEMGLDKMGLDEMGINPIGIGKIKKTLIIIGCEKYITRVIARISRGDFTRVQRSWFATVVLRVKCYFRKQLDYV